MKLTIFSGNDQKKVKLISYRAKYLYTHPFSAFQYKFALFESF